MAGPAVTGHRKGFVRAAACLPAARCAGIAGPHPIRNSRRRRPTSRTVMARELHQSRCGHHASGGARRAVSVSFARGGNHIDTGHRRRIAQQGLGARRRIEAEEQCQFPQRRERQRNPARIPFIAGCERYTSSAFAAQFRAFPDSASLQPAATRWLLASDSQYHDVLDASSISGLILPTSFAKWICEESSC
jgi:hypothetical protein